MKITGDLTDPRWIWLKGGLFVLLGSLSATLLLCQLLTLTSVALLVITIWSFCRAYYFAFYVIEHYVDPSYKFAGLIDFVSYALRQSRRGPVGGRSRTPPT